MSSLRRMLAILDYFTERRPTWTIEELIEASGHSRATLYRYVKELAQSGLLVKIAGTLYGLGARIIELDRLVRVSDPLLAAGRAIVADLYEASGKTSLLCSLLRNNVTCIDLRRAPDLPREIGHDRGLAMPLFRSASSRIILAFLPPARLKRLYATNGADIDAAGLGASWDAFKETLRRVRRDGYVESHGELVAGLAGIAVPIFNREKDVLGSLSFVMSDVEVTDEARRHLLSLLIAGAQRMDEALGRLSDGTEVGRGLGVTTMRSRPRSARGRAVG
jgi:DNA-binding IclR family transcriptional regulator